MIPSLIWLAGVTLAWYPIAFLLVKHHAETYPSLGVQRDVLVANGIVAFLLACCWPAVVPLAGMFLVSQRIWTGRWDTRSLELIEERRAQRYEARRQSWIEERS